jgi:hypothetical protein
VVRGRRRRVEDGVGFDLGEELRDGACDGEPVRPSRVEVDVDEADELDVVARAQRVEPDASPRARARLDDPEPRHARTISGSPRRSPAAHTTPFAITRRTSGWW